MSDNQTDEMWSIHVQCDRENWQYVTRSIRLFLGEVDLLIKPDICLHYVDAVDVHTFLCCSVKSESRSSFCKSISPTWRSEITLSSLHIIYTVVQCGILTKCNIDR